MVVRRFAAVVCKPLVLQVRWSGAAVLRWSAMVAKKSMIQCAAVCGGWGGVHPHTPMRSAAPFWPAPRAHGVERDNLCGRHAGLVGPGEPATLRKDAGSSCCASSRSPELEWPEHDRLSVVRPQVRAAQPRLPQRFCGPKCRNAFWSALRRWGDRAHRRCCRPRRHRQRAIPADARRAARGEMATRPRRSPARQPPIAGRPGEGGGGGWEVTGARRYISLRRHAPAGGSCSRTVNAPRGLSPPRRASARLPRRSCRHGLGRFSGSPVSKASREDTSLTAGR
jgi:hypothetical protein